MIDTMPYPMPIDEAVFPEYVDPDGDTVAPCFACPGCGEARIDMLVWTVDVDDPTLEPYVKCETCGYCYDPNADEE